MNSPAAATSPVLVKKGTPAKGYAIPPIFALPADIFGIEKLKAGGRPYRDLTHLDYAEQRKMRGSQAEVAALLDVARETVARRETGAQPLGREAFLALLSLPAKA